MASYCLLLDLADADRVGHAGNDGVIDLWSGSEPRTTRPGCSRWPGRREAPAEPKLESGSAGVAVAGAGSFSVAEGV